MAKPVRVLLVEDNPGDALLVQEFLSEAAPGEFVVEHLSRLEPALKKTQARPWDVILLDLSLPDAHGLDTVRQMLGAVPQIPIVVMSGLGDQEVALTAVKEGAQDYLVKGQVDGVGLCKSLRYALERARTKRLLAEARERAELLAALGDALQAAHTPQQIAEITAPRIGPMLRADYVALSRQDGEVMRLIYVWGKLPLDLEREALQGIARQRGGMVWRVVEEGQALYTENYAAQPHQIIPLGDYAVAVEPVRGSDGRVRATLSAGRPGTEGPWLQGERDLMARIAATLGLALERAELLQRLEADRAQTSAVLGAMLESAPTGFAFLDTQLRYRHINRELAELNGISMERHLGRTVEEAMPRIAQRVLPHLRQVLETGQPVLDQEFEGVGPLAGRYWLVSYFPVRRGDGVVIGVGIITQEVTERRRTEMILRESEARLRSINEAQKRFVSDAAHELRAPLTAIMGNLELLHRFPNMAPGERAAALSETEQEARRMSRLVSDLLTLARGDGGVPIRQDTISLKEVLLKAFNEARHLAKGHRLELDLAQDLRVKGDSDYLKQLALILLDNAIKYTPASGTVRLELRHQPPYAEFSVHDDGPGIPDEDLPKVFERFYRADKSRHQDPGGSGLGLSIAKWIVDSHRGQLSLESRVGKGTRAVVRLPLSTQSEPRDDPQASSPGV